MNPSSAAMIRSLFLNKQALEKGAARPGQPDQSVQEARRPRRRHDGRRHRHVAAQAGIEVVLIDRDQAAADQRPRPCRGLLDEGVKRKRTTPEKKAEVLARITATPDYAALAGCDLVVEAVFEDPAVKAEATRRAEAAPARRRDLRHQHLDAADQRARQGQPRRRDQFIGIHFFSPVDKMALVEIIRGTATGDRAVAKALDFVRQIRQDPDRRQRRPLLLRQPLHHPLHQRGRAHGRRGRRRPR